jgi:branched-chain amino acid transport system substrate-binding protein
MSPRLIVVACSALISSGALAAPGDNMDIVRDLASRIGPIVGSALACRDIARPRIQVIVDKFAAVIREAASSDSDRDDLNKLLDRSVADGRAAVANGRTDCRLADRQLADIERSIATPVTASQGTVPAPAAAPPPPPVAFVPPPPVAAAPPPPAPVVVANAPATVPLGTPTGVRGITDKEIKFGISAAFTGPTKEIGRQLKLGIEVAFNRVNDAGGIDGRMLKLAAADDGNEPTHTLDSMKQLYEKEQVFCYIGNAGTPTAAVSVPYALERRTVIFGPFTGAPVVRHDPPDRYIFNFRPSYAEETDAAVRYLVKLRRLQPRQIAVFAQGDSFGDAGFAGVAKAFRALGVSDTAILRLNYVRNTVNVDEAVNTLKAQKVPIKAVVMVATYRSAAKFIEKTREVYPGLIYTNVSAVGGTALADELMLLGPRYASGVIVTQVVPAVSGYSSAILEYKAALAKYFPGEAPDYVSLESYVDANVLIQAIKRAGPQLDSEKLVDTLESMRNIDLGLGATLGFGRAEHQASHKIWGTQLDDNGKYQAIEIE